MPTDEQAPSLRAAQSRMEGGTVIMTSQSRSFKAIAESAAKKSANGSCCRRTAFRFTTVKFEDWLSSPLNQKLYNVIFVDYSKNRILVEGRPPE